MVQESSRVALWLDARDNVATTLDGLGPGDEVVVEANGERATIAVIDSIPFGHKIAVRHICSGADIVKYGEVIGQASVAIRQGAHVHLQNCVSLRGKSK